MKRKKTTNPHWLIIAIACLSYVAIVGVLKQHSAPAEASADKTPKVSTTQKATHSSHKRKTASASKRTTPKATIAQEQTAIAQEQPASPAIEVIGSPQQEPEPSAASTDIAYEPEKPIAAEPEKAIAYEPSPISDQPELAAPQAEETAEEEADDLEQWRVRTNAVWSVCEAAQCGDIQTLQQRIQEGETINTKDEQGNSPLHLAAAGGHSNMVIALLENGADPLATNKAGKRPAEIASNDAARQACEAGEAPRRKEIALFTAVNQGRVDEVRQALGEGVNPNALSEDNQHSLLSAAVLAGQTQVAQALLEAGANVLYIEPNSRNVLNYAAAGGKVEMVQLLLSFGADPMLHTNHGAYPIHDAIWSGKTSTAIALIPCYKAVRFSPDGKGNGYPICMAISRGNMEVVKAFLEAGLDPNDRLFADNPLLIQAVKSNRTAIAQLLLEAGADKNAKDKSGKRAIDYAQNELAKLLK